MKKLNKYMVLLLFMLMFFSCKESTTDKKTSSIEISKSETNNKKILNEIPQETVLTVNAELDSVSISEIKSNTSEELPTIFDYYKIELEDEVAIWSDKMFGRCCTEADLLYSELLSFDISANINNEAYPHSNLSDTKYRTAFAFKENQNVEISLKLDRDSEYHLYHTKLSVDEVLKSNDTILKPFRLSLVNGYTKSEETFNQNGRVKEMKVFINGKYKNTVVLKDTPSVQQFSLDFPFRTNDVVTLVPKTIYPGEKYDDVCISEIQGSLGDIAYPPLNKKYNPK